MGIFATRRQLKDFRIAVQAVRDCGIAVSGPYRRRNGTLVFSVADCVLTEGELLSLECGGKLNPNELLGVLSESKKLAS